MSYSVYLRGVKCEACGHQDSGPECPDPTYNLTPIFDLALSGEDLPNPDIYEGAVVLLGKKTDRPRGLRLLSGRVAAETLPDINRAIERLSDERLHETFIALEPPNKWGTVDGALEVMKKLRLLATENPMHVWEIN